jgi:FMN phosphatase YigB (HAD superfamily)
MSVSSAAFRLGQEVSGPLFVPFCDWIVEETKRAELSHILFLARDGQLLKKITDLRHPNLGTITTHYFYAGSRASWYRCTPHVIPMEVLEFRIRTEYQTLRKTCEALGFDYDSLDTLADIAPDQKLQRRDQQLVARYFSSLEGRKKLASLSEPNRALLIDYLGQFGIRGDQRVAIVDVGWNGHFQSSLELMLEPRNICVHGFYFGLNRPPYGSERKSFMYGPNEFPNWMSFYPCLIEILTPADHPAVPLLAREGHQITPVFAGTPVSQPEIIQDLHDGALSFAAEAPLGCPPFNIRLFVENPPAFATDVLSHFYFQKPFSPEVEESFVHAHPFAEAAKLAWSFRRNLNSWHWPQANLQKSDLTWLGAGLTTRFMIGFRVKRAMDRLKKLFSLSSALVLALIANWFDFRRYEVISFDIFDTLFFRRCGGYFKIFEELEHRTNMEGLAHLRKQTEVQLLLKLQREITLDEIYEALKKSLPAQNWEEIKILELEIEEANLEISTKGKRYLERARNSGASIVFISDMYLSREWIHEQLCRHEIWREDDLLFVSNEIGVNKRSGELFEIIKREFPEASWKHFGDNLLSDVVSAYRSGIPAKWLPHSYVGSISDHLLRLRNRRKWSGGI